ncbi:XRE family transcriptional regulator [Paenibacillus polymyxa]|uniref:XRE family transcriptional regulator n=1 Tax=Paenibacillus TaxID=44249 RepID=UPI002AB4CDDB|nr:XRE family transcriptional regulator [Paenibacillus polymyxa]MDY8046602.1 XRE family transcriptional regulator [Paenibacillus polymyxa]
MNNRFGTGTTSRQTHIQQPFVPYRLRQVRIALGFSTIDFSDAIGVSRQALNQFETNRITPSYETMLEIESVTGFPTSYFYKPFSLANEGPFLFRSNATSLKKAKELSKFIMQQMQDVYDYYSNFIDFAQVNIPAVDFDVSSTLEDIEDIAVEVRKYWGLGLGPISHVYRLLENNGILIAQLNKRIEKIDAFSQWRNGRPFVLVGSKEFTVCRLRLNAMHEFGHLLMHTDGEYEERSNKDKEFYDQIEAQAYRFAGAFLLPRESFLDELYSTSLSHLIELKQRWKVSLAAIVRRCKDLEVITDSRYEMLMRQVKKYGKMEPLDDSIEKEYPSAFSQAANLILDHGVKTRGELVDELRIPANMAEFLTGVEEGFFTERSLESKVVKMKFGGPRAIRN